MKYLILTFLFFNTLFADIYTDDELTLLEVMEESQPLESSSNELLSNLMDSAFEMMGAKYRFGATGTETTDCSNFTKKTYNRIGISLPRTAAEQSKIGVEVAKEDLQAGDLLFFKTRGLRIGHVGIYIGDGKMIHASYRLKEVVVDSINKAYYLKRFVTAKRLLTLE